MMGARATHPHLGRPALAEPMRILLVEDSADDADLIARELAAGGVAATISIVDSIDALDAALGESWDVVVSDYHLAGFDATTVLDHVRELAPDLPVLVVSGSIGEESAVEVMRRGAHDFLLKGHLHRLCAAILREVESSRTRTERRAADAELAEARARLSTIFAQTSVGIAQHDCAGRFVFANTRFCELTGRALPSLLRLHGKDVIAAQDAARYTHALDDVTSGKGPRALELRYERADGTISWIDASLSPLRSAAGAVIGVVSVLHDATKRHNAEIERELLVAELSRTVGFNEMFAGILGHDLRNPLNTISLSSQLLLSRAEPAAVPSLQRISRATERMRSMIDQLLDFTRIRVGRGIGVSVQPCDLAKICHQAIDELLRERGPQIELEVRGDTEGAWDQDRLLQLVSNLTANAVTHGQTTAPVRVFVDGTDAGSVQLSVANAGSIPDIILPFLFDPFHPSKASSRGRTDGLGLGLYIAQQIALAHGAEIRALSTAADGTRFDVTLPRSHESSAR